MTKRVQEFEGLRGILAWWVVASHIIFMSGIDYTTLPRYLHFLRMGSLAVDIFIILSGYVIMSLLHCEKVPYDVYLKRRFLRLFPILAVCLTISLFTFKHLAYILQQVSWVDKEGLVGLSATVEATQSRRLTHYLLQLSLLSGLVPSTVLPNASGGTLFPAWSVSLEWQYYLIAPFVARMLTDINVKKILCIGTASIALFFVFHHYFTPAPFKSALPLKWHYFVLGIATYFCAQWLNKSNYTSAASCIVASVGIFVGISLKNLPISVWFVVLTVSLINNSREDFFAARLIRNVLLSVPLQYLGKISYSTYLIHFPILYVAMWLLLHINPSRASTDKFYFGFATAALALPIIFVASVILNRWIETPFIKIGKGASLQSAFR